MTGFRSFNISAGKRVPNLLQAGYLKLRKVVVKRITVVKFGYNMLSLHLFTRVLSLSLI